MKYARILYQIFFIFFFINSLFSQDSDKNLNELLTKSNIDSSKYPVNTIKLFFDENTKVPIDITKEDILIQEKTSAFYKTAEIQNYQILNTFNVKKTEQNKSRFFFIAFDITKSISQKDFEKLKSLAKDFVKEKSKNDVVSLYAFDTNPKLVLKYSKNLEDIKEKIEGLVRKGKETKLYDSIFKVLIDYKKAIGKNKDSIGGVVFFTDGKEEISVLREKDIDELIIFGTKFSIPIYFVLINNNSFTKKLEKISLKTGGEVFYSNLDANRIFQNENGNQQNGIFIKELMIKYKSNLSIKEYLFSDEVAIDIYIKNNLVSRDVYKISNIQYHILIYILVGIFIIIIIALLIFAYVKKKQRESVTLNNQEISKIKLPEPEIDDVFIDSRQYIDHPEKKYVESEKKESIPLIAQSWMDPRDYMLHNVDDLSKKIKKDTLNLSLKEKSYLVLQSALKEAPKYNHGILIKKDREGLGDKQFDIFLDEVYIGSSTTAHIPVRDTAVSALHAKIKRIDNKFILFDLMSSVGTYLNGKKVLRPMPLRHNDEIRMGYTVFRFIGED